MNKNTIVVIVAVAAALVVLAPLGMKYFQNKSTPDVNSAAYAELIATGATIYSASCAVCHGANLEGQPDWRTPNEDGIYPAPPHNNDGHTWHHTDNVLFDYTSLGGAEALRKSGVEGVPSGMPAFGDSLTEDEILAVLAFIKSTWSDRNRAAQQERTKAAQE